MKKLMLLGGSRYLMPVIKAAHNLGIYVITCDYLPHNFAHKYSDEYINVSIINKEEVLHQAEILRIDGIMSFACDPGVITAAYVAEKLNLPNVGPYRSVCILQNKKKFREFLLDNGFRVPYAKGYSDVAEAMEDGIKFEWPMIVKPTDSAGSKGVSRVDSYEQLEDCIKYAMSYSKAKEFIIEKYIEQKGYSSDSDSFSVDGTLEFVSFNCQYFDKNAKNPYTPAAYSWPSTICDEKQQELKSEIQRLLRLLNMGTAIYNIEVREDLEGNVYIMELSPRGGGNRLSECLRYATGVDLIENMVKYSVGMDVTEIVQPPYDGLWAEVIVHSDKEGFFDRLWISDVIKDEIVEEDMWVENGDYIGAFEAANEAIGTIVLRFCSNEKMEIVMNNLVDYISVVVK